MRVNFKLTIILFVLSSFFNTRAEEFCNCGNNYYNVKYINNYDGDTAKFEILIYEKGTQEIIIKENVRFKNINAEEIRNKDEKKKAIAIKQKEELKNRLLKAKQIDLLNCEKEKYGRLLCELEVVN